LSIKGRPAKRCILAVNLRGSVNVPQPVKQTLYGLKLSRRFNATLLLENEAVLGMLHKAKEHVAWTAVGLPVIQKLLEAKTELMHGETMDSMIKALKAKNIEGLAKSIAEGKVNFRKLRHVRPYFRLHPPRGGFKKSTRRQYGEGGVLGNNPELPNYVEKMIN
jgi:large subunit ribosomal protein L30